MRRAVVSMMLTIGLAAGGTAAAQTAGIATSNPGSLMHSIGSAVARAANESGLRTTIQAATSPGQYLPFVSGNEIEFGVSNLEELQYALQSAKWFKGQDNRSLRVVALIMPLRVGLFVRKDSDIKTIADLKGRRMADGFVAQLTVLPQIDGILETAGLTRDDIVSVQVPSVVGGAKAFMSGAVEAFYFAHGAGKVREADAAVGGIYALPVDNSPKALETLRKHWQTAQIITINPGPAAPGVPKPASYLAFPQAVSTNAEVDDETVYKMTKAIYENQKLLAKTFPPFRQFDPKQHMVGDIGPAQYHPGAVKFYREVSLWK